MAQANSQNSPDRRVNRHLIQMSIQACKADDVSLLEQAISLASHPNSRFTVEEVVLRGLQSSVMRGAVNVLHYVLDRGADVRKITASHVTNYGADKPSQEVLEILVAHGWDVNIHNARSWPLLWFVTGYHNVVAWCLDHGASVDVPEEPLEVLANGVKIYSRQARPTILGMVAFNGSVETFELLRAKNAPLDPRTLHRAVEQATLSARENDSDGSNPGFDRDMDMIRHLVDVLKLDVNAVEPQIASDFWTPLCFPAMRPIRQRSRELIEFLLDRGADPNLGGIFDDATPNGHRWLSPIEIANSNKAFLQIVQEWEASHKLSDGTG